MTMEATLPFRIKMGFGSGQIAGQVFRDTPSLLLLFFLTSVVGIEPAVAGTAVFVPKLFWGVISDLGVGLLADHFNARFPRRRWLLMGAIAAPLAMILIFQVPDGSTALRVGYVVVTFSLYMMAFATFSVPYLSQFSEITDSPRERTVLMAWRHGFTGVGLLVGSALTPAVIHWLGGGRSAYALTSCLLAAICAASLFTAYTAASSIPMRARLALKINLRSLGGVVKYRPFRILLATAFTQEVGAGMSYASIAFFLTYNMRRADALEELALIGLMMGFVVMLGSPFWVFVSRRLGKKKTYLVAAIGHSATQFVWGLSTGSTPTPLLFLYAATIGLTNSGWGIMNLAMLGDTIARATRETGQDRAGSFSALWALAEKIALAAGGTLIVGFVLSGFGFSAALAAHGGTEPDSAMTGIALSFAFAPSLLNLSAALFFWRFGQASEAPPAWAPDPAVLGASQ